MLQLDWARLKLILSMPITESQVLGFNAILKVLNEENATKEEASYILATALHETNRKMIPKEEDEYTEFYVEMYDIEGSRKTTALRLGNTEAGDGEKYKQRGFISILGKNNYKALEELLKLPLVEKPELLTDIEVASKALVKGMLEGTYTGFYLSKYINKRNVDYVNARRVTKGIENAKKVSILAQQIERAVKEV